MKRQIEYIATSQLHPYANNSNTHSDWQIKKIADSIKKFGFTNPVLVAEDMTILAGHGRCLAAMQIEMDEIPCIILKGMTTDDAKAYVIADNQLAKLSEWDHKVLASELIELQELEYDLNVIGFDDKELDKLRGLVPDAGWPEQETEGNTDDDEIPEVEQNIHGVKLGDVYQLGNHRLMCGDSTCEETVRMLMNGEKADMVFTDPPYNLGSHTKCVGSDVNKAVKDLSENSWDSDFDIKPALKLIGENATSSAPFYIFTSQFLAPDIWEWMKDRCQFYSYIVWCKPNPMPSLIKKTWNFSSTELICYGHGKQLTFNYPEQGHAKAYWEFNKTPHKDHPTSKPVELIEHAINHASKPGYKILDTFLGSGSTLIACEKTNRKCYGMELDPHYCSVIIERWQNFTGKTAELIDRTHSDLCQAAGLSSDDGDAICVDGCPDNEPMTQPSGCL